MFHVSSIYPTNRYIYISFQNNFIIMHENGKDTRVVSNWRYICLDFKIFK